jgi:putative ABC transport system permease protein
MGTIFTIALRNLTQHKAKTLIIGVLIIVSIALGLVGNTLLDSARNSLERTFTQNFTGDVLVLPKDVQGGVFGASQGDGSNSGPPILPMMKDYAAAAEIVKKQPGIENTTSQISSYVLFNFQDDGFTFGLTFGIEPESYFQAFDNVVLVEGRKLNPGETGIMLHEKVRDAFKKDPGVTVKVGDTVQLNNFGESGFKIREVPVVGIFKFRAGNERTFAFMQPNFVDVNTLRALKGKAVVTPDDLKLKASVQKALDASSDDFFDAPSVVAAPAAGKASDLVGKTLGPRTTDRATTDRGAWNYILIHLKPGVDGKTFIANLNAQLKDAKLEVKAQNWFDSGHPDSGVFWAISTVFNIVVWLIAIVSVIIIMNTLVASVMERTPEIGTMRALGAQKGFVAKMFVTETTTLTVIFGLVGMVVGFGVLGLIGTTGIPAPNDFMKLIFGGDVLHPVMALGPVVVALIIIVFIALVSWILPVLMALKVSPLKAINAD